MSMENTVSLQRENQRLRRKITSLERAALRSGGGLHGMLARRGLKPHRSVPPQRLLLDLRGRTGPLDEWYRLLHRYSFRLFLRDV